MKADCNLTGMYRSANLFRSCDIITIVYEVRIQRRFTACHALTVRGEVEPVHEHDWGVEVRVSGIALDADGLLVDFHALEKAVDEVIGPWRGTNLHEVEPFGDQQPPSAEIVARVIAERVIGRLRNVDGALDEARGVHVSEVLVTEAVDCVAVYRPT